MKTLREMMDMIEEQSEMPSVFSPEEFELIHTMADNGDTSSAIAHRIGNCTVADIDALLDRKPEQEDDWDDSEW